MYSWHSGQKLVYHIGMHLFLGSLFCSIGIYTYTYIHTYTHTHTLCQYHAALVTVALQYILQSESVMVPALFFFRIDMAICGFLWFHLNSELFFYFGNE